MKFSLKIIVFFSFLGFQNLSIPSVLSANNNEIAVNSCFEIWKVIDVVRAIKYTHESREHFCSGLLDNFIILYADILKFSKNSEFKPDSQESQYLSDTLTNIKFQFFDVFYDVSSREFFCICLILDKIDLILNIK